MFLYYTFKTLLHLKFYSANVIKSLNVENLQFALSQFIYLIANANRIIAVEALVTDYKLH